MKKILSLLMSACAVLSAVPASVSAQEYEKCPPASEFASYDDFYKELSDGIKDGRYFADFDGNGTFNPVDSEVLLYYYAELSTLSEGMTVDWSDREMFIEFDADSYVDFLSGYKVVDFNGITTVVSVPLSNEILENVQKYGDITGDGAVMPNDASDFLYTYYKSFELGDVNTDGRVDSVDASCVLRYYAVLSTHGNVYSYTARAMSVLGDVNGDGAVMADDASEILNMYSVSAVAE